MKPPSDFIAWATMSSIRRCSYQMPLSLNLLLYSLRIKEPKTHPHVTFHSRHSVYSLGRDRLGGFPETQSLGRLVRVIVPLPASWLKEDEKRYGGGRKDRKQKAKKKTTHTKHTRDVQSQTGMII